MLPRIVVLLVAFALPSFAAEPQVWVCQPPNGSVIVVAPAERNRMAGEADEAFYQRVLDRTRQANPALREIPCVRIKSSEVPADRKRRDAWRLRGGQIVIEPQIAPDPSRTPGSR